MAMIEKWNETIKSNEVIIVLAVKSSTADFVWYRLQNNEIVSVLFLFEHKCN